MVIATIPTTGKKVDVWYDLSQSYWCYKGERTPVARFDSLKINLGNEIKAAEQIAANLKSVGTREASETAGYMTVAIQKLTEATMWLNAARATGENTVLLDE